MAELALEIIGGALRTAGRILIEVVFEVIIKGTGYAIIKVFRPRPQPDEAWCALVGLVVFAAAIVAGFAVFHFGSAR